MGKDTYTDRETDHIHPHFPIHFYLSFSIKVYQSLGPEPRSQEGRVEPYSGGNLRE
jgi:hypothetical protein